MPTRSRNPATTFGMLPASKAATTPDSPAGTFRLARMQRKTNLHRPQGDGRRLGQRNDDLPLARRRRVTNDDRVDLAPVRVEIRG